MLPVQFSPTVSTEVSAELEQSGIIISYQGLSGLTFLLLFSTLYIKDER
jgi:hypothetical protein